MARLGWKTQTEAHKRKMLGQIVAFLAIATTAALANSWGCCYPGYGSYVNAVPAFTTGFYGSGVLSTGYASPIVAGVASSLPFAAVGVPEVSSSCENNALVAGEVSAPVVSGGVVSPVVSTGIVSPVVSSGVISTGVLSSGFGCGCGRRTVATSF